MVVGPELLGAVVYLDSHDEMQKIPFIKKKQSEMHILTEHFTFIRVVT